MTAPFIGRGDTCTRRHWDPKTPFYRAGNRCLRSLPKVTQFVGARSRGQAGAVPLRKMLLTAARSFAKFTGAPVWTCLLGEGIGIPRIG